MLIRPKVKTDVDMPDLDPGRRDHQRESTGAVKRSLVLTVEGRA
jgi:hypothetical protein